MLKCLVVLALLVGSVAAQSDFATTFHQYFGWEFDTFASVGLLLVFFGVFSATSRGPVHRQLLRFAFRIRELGKRK